MASAGLETLGPEQSAAGRPLEASRDLVERMTALGRNLNEKESKAVLDALQLLGRVQPNAAGNIAKLLVEQTVTVVMTDSIEKVVAMAGMNDVQGDALTISLMRQTAEGLRGRKHLTFLEPQALSSIATTINTLVHEMTHVMRKQSGESNPNHTLEEIHVFRESIEVVSGAVSRLRELAELPDNGRNKKNYLAVAAELDKLIGKERDSLNTWITKLALGK